MEEATVVARECGYQCDQTGKVIRAWEVSNTIWVCLADIFVTLQLKPQEIEMEPHLIDDELCVPHDTFLQILDNSEKGCTEGTAANMLKQFLWAQPVPA